MKNTSSIIFIVIYIIGLVILILVPLFPYYSSIETNKISGSYYTEDNDFFKQRINLNGDTETIVRMDNLLIWVLALISLIAISLHTIGKTRIFRGIRTGQISYVLTAVIWALYGIFPQERIDYVLSNEGVYSSENIPLLFFVSATFSILMIPFIAHDVHHD